MSLLETVWKGLDSLERSGIREMVIPYVPLFTCSWPSGKATVVYNEEQQELTPELWNQIQQEHPPQVVTTQQMRNNALSADELLRPPK